MDAVVFQEPNEESLIFPPFCRHIIVPGHTNDIGNCDFDCPDGLVKHYFEHVNPKTFSDDEEKFACCCGDLNK